MNDRKGLAWLGVLQSAPDWLESSVWKSVIGWSRSRFYWFIRFRSPSSKWLTAFKICSPILQPLEEMTNRIQCFQNYNFSFAPALIIPMVVNLWLLYEYKEYLMWVSWIGAVHATVQQKQLLCTSPAEIPFQMHLVHNTINSSSRLSSNCRSPSSCWIEWEYEHHITLYTYLTSSLTYIMKSFQTMNKI